MNAPAQTAYLALGSNQGDRSAALDLAVRELSRRDGIRFLAESTRIDNAPVGGPAGQDNYLNSACRIETRLEPDALLAAVGEIELSLGRDRSPAAVRWGPRAIDIDILLYGDFVLASPLLTIPHPRLTERVFVLQPLCELAPALVVPGTGTTVAELLRRLTDP